MSAWSAHRLGLAAGHDVADGAQLSVDVIVDHGVPLGEAVQRAQDAHDLLRQRAAVSGRERSLGAGLPPPQGTFCLGAAEAAVSKRQRIRGGKYS